LRQPSESHLIQHIHEFCQAQQKKSKRHPTNRKERKQKTKFSLTCITLPKHLGEVKRPLDSLIPKLSFKREFGLGVSFRNGGQLEKVACDDHL
jgi:hypothetical protein